MSALANHLLSRSAHARPRRTLALGAAVLLCLGVVPPTPSFARSAGDPGVIGDWTVTAVTTAFADPSRKPQEATLYIAFVDAAMYDAVVGIDGRYEPYALHASAPPGASDEAAAIAAAHRVLVTYEPYAQAALDAHYAASLARVPDGPGKDAGVAYGVLAADTLIARRVGDGRDGDATFTQPPAPGVWRPTPPLFLPMAVPWLGSVTPMLVRSGAQFGEPGPPPALTSARYTRDFAEVKAVGSATSTARTVEQTTTARFFSGSPVVAYNLALEDQVSTRGLDLVAAARLFAAVNMSVNDAIISVWHAKLLYAFWRPITAITLADKDGNPATSPDPAWTPLLVTPPYPDYVSGYCGVTGAFTRALARAMNRTHLDLTLTSTALPGVTRYYDSGRALDDDVVNARVWLGIHFRTADVEGVAMGERVADWALSHYFQPLEDD